VAEALEEVDAEDLAVDLQEDLEVNAFVQIVDIEIHIN
jgi:hypothetical protein